MGNREVGPDGLGEGGRDRPVPWLLGESDSYLALGWGFVPY